MLVIATISQVALIWPAAPFWQDDGSFDKVFGTSWRLFLASFVAYSCQFIDVYVFDFVRQATQRRFLWLRNNISTMISQFLADVSYVLISFIGVYSWRQLSVIIFTSYIIRLMIAVIDTPIVYLMVNLIRKHRKEKHNPTEPMVSSKSILCPTTQCLK
ncbi:MAG: queuosine precursor transporter [Gammaproteobacteria bacterium]|nr:queuosine precursor transporter [Gammaproteobacteria bacterium]